MRYSNRLMGRNVPFVPLSGSNVGLLERRLNAASWLGLSDTAEQNGDWDREASSTMLLDTDADYHKNNAEDPATDTLNMSDSATLVRDLDRTINDSMTLNDFAHVCLCGYQAAGSGDTDRTLVTMTAGEDIDKGQPVVCLTANTVNLANNFLGSPANSMIGYVIGLANTSATAGNDIEIATEGTVELSDWYDIIGRTTLEPGSWYYLNGPTAGKMTVNAVEFAGRMAIRCGRALDTTRFDIEISDGVIL
jgi:hypothetical protein